MSSWKWRATPTCRERIFPIVLADALIYRSYERAAYFKYWDEQIKKLNQAIKEIDVVANVGGLTDDLEDKYHRIRTNFDQLTDLLSDMNALTPDLHAAEGMPPSSTLSCRSCHRSRVPKAAAVMVGQARG